MLAALRMTWWRLATALAAGAFAPALAAGMPTGFQGLQWGAPVAALGAHRRPVNIPGAAAGIECFDRSDEKRSIDGVPIDEVVWCFLDGGLYQAGVGAKSAQYAPLVEVFRRAWGEPLSRAADFARWGRDEDAGSATIVGSVRGRECRFTIRSTDALARIQQAQRRRGP